MTSQIIAFETKHKNKLIERRCSFCNTPESMAKSLLHAEKTDKYICDKCIIKCKELVNDSSN
jgi:hypothetical protein